MDISNLYTYSVKEQSSRPVEDINVSSSNILYNSDTINNVLNNVKIVANCLVVKDKCIIFASSKVNQILTIKLELKLWL